ncbi:MAG: hypothetical protein ACK4SY_04025 [Pyrobaculum sp.]
MRYLVLGAVDGLITAGTISAALLFRGGRLDPSLALSLAVVVATINALTVFVSEFSHQIREVREVSYKLSLRDATFRWTLLHTRAVYASMKSALLNFAASLLGASSILAAAVFSPMAIIPAAALVILSAGFLIARESWVEFIELVAMVSLAVMVGLLVGLAFPIIA